ncbi:uncharacterized protein LOC105699940 [Orussus abietinus]|uniref:uncharacterized protein LOC105699940 n=1 Tax=Orussus abietinus TaxID=222816 RepID=UPI000625E859|nr:uncharacterized protein LOC105699940 [Orussus abietinus]
MKTTHRKKEGGELRKEVSQAATGTDGPETRGARRRGTSMERPIRVDRSFVESEDSWSNAASGDGTGSAGDSLTHLEGSQAPPREEGALEVLSNASSDSPSVTGTGKRKGKRGRPLRTSSEDSPVNPVPKRQFLEAVDAEETLKEKKARKPARSSKPLPSLEKVAKEMRLRPAADLGAEVFEAMGEVERVAKDFGHLQDAFVRCLRLAALHTKAAATELLARTVAGTGAERLEQENQQLRIRLEATEGLVRKLATEVETLKARPSGPKGASTDAGAGAWRRRPPPPAAPDTRSTDLEGGGPGILEQVRALMTEGLRDIRRELLSEFQRGGNPYLLAGSPAGGPPVAMGTVVPSTATATTADRRRRAGAKQPLAPTPPTQKEKKDGGRRDAPRAGPSRAPPGGEDSHQAAGLHEVPWARVVGRKSKKGKEGEGLPPSKPVRHSDSGGKGAGRSLLSKPRARRPLTLKEAAVTLTVQPGAGIALHEVMTRAKREVDLSELNIDGVRPRRAVTGALILEVPGPDSVQKAGQLKERLKAVFKEEEVRVVRPTKMAEVRVRDLEDSVTPPEVANAIAQSGDCDPGDVRVGVIRPSPSGLGTAWIRCPAGAAKKLVATGKLRVGWTIVRVEALVARPLQCFQCLELGHMRATCPGQFDRL